MMTWATLLLRRQMMMPVLHQGEEVKLPRFLTTRSLRTLSGLIQRRERWRERETASRSLHQAPAPSPPSPTSTSSMKTSSTAYTSSKRRTPRWWRCTRRRSGTGWGRPATAPSLAMANRARCGSFASPTRPSKRPRRQKCSCQAPSTATSASGPPRSRSSPPPSCSCTSGRTSGRRCLWTRAPSRSCPCPTPSDTSAASERKSAETRTETLRGTRTPRSACVQWQDRASTSSGDTTSSS
mmetsp:Transcript_19339/g.39485  ORF Transcript_19339/g.39485 Transcript_19339/m.39485 type:complete len:239 (-) Transcript_19339:90-806(-)